MFEEERKKMVEYLRVHNVSEKVLAAMKKVPRHLFLPEDTIDHAYEDRPYTIGYSQTISAPHMVAIMCDLLELREGLTVLEIGTGSGYHAAVIAELIGDGHVYTVERIKRLAEFARENLREAGYSNVTIIVGDGTLGLPDHAPYDCISVTCAAPSSSSPLTDQLKVGGRMIIPVGKTFQDLYLIKKKDGLQKEKKMGVIFVPLIGKYGFHE
jgi:protein-L-isoaspartate(D-aspartate) O-methyltransferase